MRGSDFLQLDPSQAPRRGRTTWLVDRLRAAIMGGTLKFGAKLPATRTLAAELSMARGTVAEAYQRLAEEGLLMANRGGGTIVAATPAAPDITSPPLDAEPATRLFDISSRMPDLGAFPRAAWLRAERQVLATATNDDLGYADPKGAPRLRAALAGWLARSRGVSISPERVIVTAGVTGALSLLAQVLYDRGIASCAVEDPGAEGNRRILDYWLDTVVPIPIDEYGLEVDRLAASGERAVLVTPAHQFPSGVVLSPQRRRDLHTWAQECDGLVIEDDYDSEYSYDRAPAVTQGASARTACNGARAGHPCVQPVQGSCTGAASGVDDRTPAIAQGVSPQALGYRPRFACAAPTRPCRVDRVRGVGAPPALVATSAS